MKIVVLNHKTYLSYKDITLYIKNIKDRIRTDIDVVICPSNIFIPYFSGKYNFKLGSQDIYYKLTTGEVLGSQLKSLNVSYSIIGHSERKQNLNEDYLSINKKIKEAIKNNIKPIICVGETLEEKDRNKTLQVITNQLKQYLKDIDVKEDIVIAYEPIWAIGTNIIPSNQEIEEVINLIKDIIFKKYNVNIRVIYGGSVDTNNALRLSSITSLDGFLLGRVSIDVEEVLKIINLIK